MTAVSFVMNQRVYFAPSLKEAKDFSSRWNSKCTFYNRFKTSWKIDRVELAPKWVPVPVLDETKIEFE